jgi:hypothetical protein
MSDQLSASADFDRGRPDALLARRVRATRTSLCLQDGLSFESWSRIGLQVGTLNDASAWWIGDWLLYGHRSFGDRYRSAIGATGLSYQTLRNYAWVASQFAPSRRRDTLSFGHHAEVAALGEEGQEEWLRRAALRGWSRSELRRQLRATRDGPSGAAGPVAIDLRADEPRFGRWQAAAAAEGRALDDWVTAVLDTAAESVLDPPQRELAS